MGLSNEDIVEMLNKMDEEAKAFEEDLIQLSWAMRGMSLNETYAMSPSQREFAAKLFKKNLETTKESGLPFF